MIDIVTVYRIVRKFDTSRSVLNSRIGTKEIISASS